MELYHCDESVSTDGEYVEDVAAAMTPEATDGGRESTRADEMPAHPPHSSRSADEQQTLRRSGRECRPPGKYSDFTTYSAVTGEVVSPQTTPEEIPSGYPESYEEAGP